MTEDSLAPLEKLALKHPHLEGEVFWLRDGAWSDAAGEALESDEISFYAEGLLMEGFSLSWQILADADGPAICRLFFWQDAEATLPALPDGLTLFAQGRT